MSSVMVTGEVRYVSKYATVPPLHRSHARWSGGTDGPERQARTWQSLCARRCSAKAGGGPRRKVCGVNYVTGPDGGGCGGSASPGCRSASEVDVCRCNLPLTPPSAGIYWWPSRTSEPGPSVSAVHLHGQHPDRLRSVRVKPGGWRTLGLLANHPGVAPPRAWAAVGACWAGSEHPVVPAG